MRLNIVIKYTVYADSLVHPCKCQAAAALCLVMQVNINNSGMQVPTFDFGLQHHFVTNFF